MSMERIADALTLVGIVFVALFVVGWITRFNRKWRGKYFQKIGFFFVPSSALPAELAFRKSASAVFGSQSYEGGLEIAFGDTALHVRVSEDPDDVFVMPYERIQHRGAVPFNQSNRIFRVLGAKREVNFGFGDTLDEELKLRLGKKS